MRRVAAGMASRTSSASRAVEVSGARARSRTMASAIRRGEPLVAVLAQHPRQCPAVVAVDDVGGGRTAGRVHPHVERRVLRVGEAALGVVELQRADAEVEQDARRRSPDRGRPARPAGRRTRRGRGSPARRTARARCPLRRRASGSRSSPTSRADGAARSSASACPPMPTVQSTTTAPGADSAGTSRARHRSQQHRHVRRREVRGLPGGCGRSGGHAGQPSSARAACAAVVSPTVTLTAKPSSSRLSRTSAARPVEVRRCDRSWGTSALCGRGERVGVHGGASRPGRG